MNRELSDMKLERFSDKFLIVGYKPNGQRGLPVIYEWVTETAFDETAVCAKTRGLIKFNVFSITDGVLSFDQWTNLRITKEQEAKEKEERELLDTLKAKFEPK